MTLSVSALNAVLNAILWFAHAMIALVAQRVYVAAARLQLAKSGETHGTDSNETNFLHWLQKKISDAIRPSSMASQKTAGWAIVIMLVMFALLPAELILESGLDVRADCDVVSRQSNRGVCASPWRSVSMVRASATALLVNNFQWLNEEWDFIREGSSTLFWGDEVHSSSRSKVIQDPNIKVRFLGRHCTTSISRCTDCGTLTARHSNGVFDGIITRSSLLDAANATRECHGDMVGQGILTPSHIFCEDTLQTPVWKNFDSTTRFSTIGLESILQGISENDVRKVGQMVIQLNSSSTRVYKISCDTDGLASKDLAKSVMFMRTAQIEIHPTWNISNSSIEALRPFTTSDVLKSLFALKASDQVTNCTGKIEVYRECGIFQWRQASYVCFLYCLMLIAWLLMSLFSSKYRDIAVPHDSITWRKYAYEGLILFHDQQDESSAGHEKSENNEVEDGQEQDEQRHNSNNDNDPILKKPTEQMPDLTEKAMRPKQLKFDLETIDIAVDDSEEIVPAPPSRTSSPPARVSVISTDKYGGFIARRLSTMVSAYNMITPKKAKSPPPVRPPPLLKMKAQSSNSRISTGHTPQSDPGTLMATKHTPASLSGLRRQGLMSPKSRDKAMSVDRGMSMAASKAPWMFRKDESVDVDPRISGGMQDMKNNRQRTVKLDCRGGEVSSKVLLVQPTDSNDQN